MRWIKWYAVMAALSFFIFAGTARECHRLSVTYPFNGFDMVFMAFYPAIVWPMSIPISTATYFTDISDERCFCFIGGK